MSNVHIRRSGERTIGPESTRMSPLDHASGPAASNRSSGDKDREPTGSAKRPAVPTAGPEPQRKLTHGLGSPLRSRAETVSRVAMTAPSGKSGWAGAEPQRTSDASTDDLVDAIRQTKAAIDKAANWARTTGTTSHGFSSMAQTIAGIASTIEAIAHQTHLLALNAAIEAAPLARPGRALPSSPKR